jgi:glutamate formiminotransferase/glutamate formiminotransferase/formiminotetrahydrofolate cyclodeaminase
MRPPLLAVPNVSEGRDQETISAIGEAFEAAGARLLDVHVDADHHRSVFTLAAAPGALAVSLLAGFEVAVGRIDISDGRGQHPHVGAIDVAPIVHPHPAERGAACAEALLLGDLIAERLQVPVLLYGELGGGRVRAELRRGGPLRLARRIEAGELAPDFGPPRLHPKAGATLVSARAPLVAFNLELAPPAGVEQARRIAALVREGGAEGLPGVRALGIALRRGSGEVAQVSLNVEDPLHVPLAAVVAAVRRHARVDRAELVGLAPEAAFRDFPDDVPIPRFDPGLHLLENALG